MSEEQEHTRILAEMVVDDVNGDDSSSAKSQETPSVRLSGAFAQPSGTFAQPSGSFAQPALLAQFAEEFPEESKEISGQYRVGNPIGRGGCAVVLEAWRLSDNMHVVIKVLQVSGGFDEKETHVAIARFMREAKLIASLHEQHIVQCVDYGCYEGTPCMVLEYVDGLSLDKFLEKYGAIPLQFATGIIEQLLSALAETHGKKIIHRDIKPGNIMVFDSPPPYEIRVLDFGISSVLDGLQSQTLMTQQGNVRGTPSYMAPELFTGESHASVESDLYAVGLVYLELLTGEIAVNDKSFMRVAYKQVNEALDIPGNIPPGIAAIIAKCCEKSPENRYHSAQVVIDEIHANIEQALKEEEKCSATWEKEKVKVINKKKSIASRRQQITNQGLFCKKNIPKLAALVVFILILIALPLYFLLINSNQDNQELVKKAEEAHKSELAQITESFEKKQAEAIAQADAVQAENKLAEQKLRLVTTKSSIQSANRSFQYSLDLANDDIDAVIKQEQAEAGAALQVEKEKPKDKNKNKKTKPKTPKTNNGASRPLDSRVDLPF